MEAGLERGVRLSHADFLGYLSESRAVVLERVRRLVPGDGAFRPILYDLVLDYPERPSKGLRPAVCLATCQAFGGRPADSLPAAVALELFHNAFLIHDDIEDGSEQRRGKPALHVTHGIPVAVNVGDATIAIAMQALIEGMPGVGPARLLRVLRTVSQMARETAEGQALELHWVRHGVNRLDDDEYIRLAEKKTAWYTFVTPMGVGAALGGASPALCDELERVGLMLGVAFQIQDDVLNLTVGEGAYGKERCGDLWEGKHTLILLHMLRGMPADERRRAQDILLKKRPPASAATGGPPARGKGFKTARDVAFLIEQIDRRGSVDYAQDFALRYASEAEQRLKDVVRRLPASVHSEFLLRLVDFAVKRDW